MYMANQQGGQVSLLTFVIPAMQEAEISRIMVTGQPGKKVMRFHLNK
jgi:hypothetical protein